MNEEINELKIEAQELKSELRNTQQLATATETAVNVATDRVLEIISKKQDEKEKRSDDQLNSLNEQLAIIFSLLQPSSQVSTQQQPSPKLAFLSRKNSQSQNHPPNFTCEIYRNTFDIERSLKNHMRREHQPQT